MMHFGQIMLIIIAHLLFLINDVVARGEDYSTSRLRIRRQISPTPSPFSTTSSGIGLPGSGGMGGVCPALAALNGQIYYLPIQPPQQQLNTLSLMGQPAGTTAILTCNPGFYPLGSSATTCQTNSQWNIPIGSCQPLPQGLGMGNNPNPSLLFTPNPNPNQGTSTTNPSLGSLPCLPMLAPLGGQLQYQPQPQTAALQQYPQGTSVQLFCANGATPAGPSQAFCQFGQWSPMTLGPCNPSAGGPQAAGTTTLQTAGHSLQDSGCAPALAPLGGRVQYSQGAQGVLGTYPAGTTATLSCTAGQPSPGQNTQAQCRGGLWNPPLGTCPTGGMGTTPMASPNTVCMFGMMAPLGTSIQYSNGAQQGPYPEGTGANVVCPQGQPQGPSSSALCLGGQWQPTFLSASCPASGGGSSVLSGVANTGVSALNSGINAVNGGLAQMGVGSQCPFGLPPVIGGTITYSDSTPPYAQGSLAQLQCNNGAFPSAGPAQATCAAGGQWQPATLGQCPLGGATGSSSPFGISMTTPTPAFGSAPSFQSQCLFGLPPVFNGRVQYSNGALMGPFPSGTQAQLMCNQGFVPSGATSANCQNGQFQPPTGLGQCVPSTMMASPPATLSMFPSMTTSRSSSTMAGTARTEPAGTATATTTNRTRLLQAEGSPSACLELPQPRNGRFVYSPIGYSAPYPVGSTITLVCAEGAQLADGSTVGRSGVCQAGGWSALSLQDACMPGGGGANSTR